VENDVNEENSNKFEEMLEKDNTNTLIHNLLDAKQIANDNNKSLTITPSEGFQLLGLFKIHFLKSVTFQLYFLVIQDRH
jgi:hypothetical protein